MSLKLYNRPECNSFRIVIQVYHNSSAENFTYIWKSSILVLINDHCHRYHNSFIFSLEGFDVTTALFTVESNQSDVDFETPEVPPIMCLFSQLSGVWRLRLRLTESMSCYKKMLWCHDGKEISWSWMIQICISFEFQRIPLYYYSTGSKKKTW